ncbi:thyroid hormone receptor-associated protein 3-like isoform X2 [Sinocyclocheilus anshuiensis]|uniref:thyroid hormone receptor-associated protein 3-like isoform X2 n=1 Tax=Sinocyclocheilus anshuiensis TaxID=1608454 RepID=UPI0007B977A4|nr:PREDICTED: thyroid hormone receptor-associated protein 3-like isoform X2 [Sinocyclocheilus anshuiensis]
MSKTQKSESRSHSQSASRSRSHSDSHSRSRSRSSSRPRSRKRRYGSRSRSRSRSHSPPPHNRERNHTREYQNQREFRGNYRGFRRPYYFRGRGQGFFRGRFQHGGRGGYYNYHPKNWQNFRQHHQQQQQQYHSNSPKRGRSRSRSPKKQSNSPQSRSHSRRSDRSSSGRSPQSHHSSSSNSGSAKRSCKDVREDISVPEETRGGNGALAEKVGGSPVAKGNSDRDRTVEKCQVLTNHDTSPKRASPQVFSTVTNDEPIDSATNETSPAHNAPNKGATTWQNVGTAPSNTCPIKKSFTPVFNGFGLFTNIDQQTDDTIAISTAFLKFLEEQKLKKQASAWDDTTHKGKSNGDIVCDKENGEMFAKGIELSCTVDHDNAGEEKSKSAKSGDGNKLSISSTKRGSRNRLTFQCEDEEMEISNRVRDMENDPCKSKSKVTLSAREMFEKRIRRMQDMAWDDELEALLLCHKQERAANILAALSKRDQFSGMFKDPSPEKLSNVNRKEKTTLSSSSKPTLLPRRSSENREQELFVVMNEESPPRASMKRSEFSMRMDSLSDDLARTPVLTNERRNLLDFLHLDKKDWEFQSVLQHLQAQQSPKSPSELFAQHIVSIVHHIKAQYFPSSGLTLNDRFAMYQRRAAEKEVMKQRKSPEIHRRIDVSPSAFKRQSLLFDEMKSSMENSFKVDGKRAKGDSMDLRLDIEHRKKYLSGEREHRDEEYGGRVSKKSPDSSKEISTEKISKNHKKPKKSKKKWEQSETSSSSSLFSTVYHEEEAEINAKGFSKVQQGLREYGEPAERRWARGGFLRIRGRSWNRGNFHGSSHGDSQMNMPAKNDDWDQEYTPKSKKYLLQSERDGEAEKKMIETRGRGRGNAIRPKGRFILRRDTNTNTTKNTSPKWAHDKFQATDDDEGEQQGEDVEQDQ